VITRPGLDGTEKGVGRAAHRHGPGLEESSEMCGIGRGAFARCSFSASSRALASHVPSMSKRTPGETSRKDPMGLFAPLNALVNRFVNLTKVAHMCGQSSNNYNEYNVCDKSRIKTQPARNVTSHARMHAARARARCTQGITKRHRPRLLTSKASTEHMTPSLASRSLSERLSAGKSGWDEPTT